jgi:hypothetical protein
MYSCTYCPVVARYFDIVVSPPRPQSNRKQLVVTGMVQMLKTQINWMHLKKQYTATIPSNPLYTNKKP